MNNGLLSWPRGDLELPGRSGLFGWPPRRTAYQARPILVENDLVGTSDAVGSTNMVVNLPTNVAVGDLIVVALKCNQNNTPGTPAGWTVLQSGAQGATGNIILIKVADGTEGATVTVTSGISAAFSAIAFRVAGSSTYSSGVAQTGSGSTPIINGVSLAAGAVAGQLPCLALFVGLSLGVVNLANVASGLFTTTAGGTTYTTFYENVVSTMRAWVMLADITGTVISAFNGVGTWTNFSVVALLVPPQRRPAVITR